MLSVVCVATQSEFAPVTWSREVEKDVNGPPRDAAARRTIPIISRALLVTLALEERVAGTMAAVAVVGLAIVVCPVPLSGDRLCGQGGTNARNRRD